MPTLSLLFGAVVGLSLGLTGGGGAIFAVPLLVYGLSVDPRQAVGISLAAVGTTSLAGFLSRWKTDQVEFLTGALFAIAGVAGAPIGSWISLRIPEALLLALFALLMLIVAVAMWRKASPNSHQLPHLNRQANWLACGRNAAGVLHLTSTCLILLGIVGLLTGILSGLFGVGGGFIIVPALVFVSGMSIHRAVGTSLLVITLISAAGVATHLLSGRNIPFDTTAYFVAGGIGGMFAGTSIGRYLSGPALQKVFAAAIVFVAVFVLLRTTFNFQS